MSPAVVADWWPVIVCARRVLSAFHYSLHSELTKKGLLDCLFSEEEFEAQRLSDFLNGDLANRHWAQDVTRSP